MRVEEYIQSMRHLPVEEINKQIEQVCGIAGFFIESGDIDMCLSSERTDKDEYGDWQTNSLLANKITKQISTSFQPQVLIEPTCGKGNFILAALDTFSSVFLTLMINLTIPLTKIINGIINPNILSTFIKNASLGANSLQHISLIDISPLRLK